MKSFWKCLLPLIFVLLIGGCATYPKNPPLQNYDKEQGYRFNNLSSTENSDSLFVILTFSGGGTRAAALSYGILEKLKDTEIEWEGKKRRLLDEVDVISSVSGGSFTAAYYGLNGDRLFENFEKKFLYRNLENELKRQLFSPVNWFKFMSPTYGRIDMAAEYYDREIFDGKTFGDLVGKGKRPFLMINATDMSVGSRFTFIQHQFDLLCSDLSGVSVARAVAASSNYPVAFTPMTVNNYAGKCGFQEPEWIKEAMKDLRLNPSRFRRAQLTRSYLDSEARPYIHLLDGGVADNIGLRGPLVALKSNDLPWNLPNKINQRGKVKKLVVIIVDAKTKPEVKFDKSPSPPGLIDVLKTISTIPIDNFSFNTIQDLLNTFKSWNKDRRFYSDCNKVLKSQCPEGDMPAGSPPPVDLFPIYVGFDQISNGAERKYYQTMATSFYLPVQEVDDLRKVAGTILDHSKEFERLKGELK